MTDQIQRQIAPNAVVALVLGICSVSFGCLFVGLACGIVGLVFANKGFNTYNANPDHYYGRAMLVAGKVTSIVGIIVSGSSFIWFI